MNLYEAIYARRSVRAYRMEPLDDTILKGIPDFLDEDVYKRQVFMIRFIQKGVTRSMSWIRSAIKRTGKKTGSKCLL